MEGEEVVEEAAGEGEGGEGGAGGGCEVGPEALAQEGVFEPGEEKVGDKGGGGDAHGDTAGLLDEGGSEADEGGGEEGVEEGVEVAEGKTRVMVSPTRV